MPRSKPTKISFLEDRGSTMPKCPLHVSVEMQPIRQRRPSFDITVGEDYERTVLVCPVESCPRVAYEYDETLRNGNKCRICHKGSVPWVGGVCGPCKSTYNARYHKRSHGRYRSNAIAGESRPRLPQ